MLATVNLLCRATAVLQATTRKTSLWTTEVLAYQEWKARYEVKVQGNERIERKLQGRFDSTKTISYL